MNSIELAKKIRQDCVRLAYGPKAVHLGGCLSMADVLAVLYAEVLTYDPHNPDWEQRDRLIVSKGHASSAVYAVLAEMGMLDHEELFTQYQNGSRLSGHVSHKIAGIEVSTGSLGHGLPIACGMAYAAKMDKLRHRVYVIMGDGELQEGTTWEAGLFAASQNLQNLTIIIDRNHLQSGGSTKECSGDINLEAFFTNMGFEVMEIDGHNHEQLRLGLCHKHNQGKPVCLIAETIKGKGISFMENQPQFHSAVLNQKQYQQAMTELGGDVT